MSLYNISLHSNLIINRPDLASTISISMNRHEWYTLLISYSLTDQLKERNLEYTNPHYGIKKGILHMEKRSRFMAMSLLKYIKLVLAHRKYSLVGSHRQNSNFSLFSWSAGLLTALTRNLHQEWTSWILLKLSDRAGWQNYWVLGREPTEPEGNRKEY